MLNFQNLLDGFIITDTVKTLLSDRTLGFRHSRPMVQQRIELWIINVVKDYEIIDTSHRFAKTGGIGYLIG